MAYSYAVGTRVTSKNAPGLRPIEAENGEHWVQVGTRDVPSSTWQNDKGPPVRRAGYALPIWEKRGRSAAADPAPEAAAPAEPFAPSAALVAARTAAKERAQDYQSGSGGSGFGERTPNFNLSGGDLFNELWAQGTSQTNDYERRFTRKLYDDANIAAMEIGEGTRHQLKNFAGKVDDVADARESFNYYMSRIDPKAAKRTA